jgi:hypothetical protein
MPFYHLDESAAAAVVPTLGAPATGGDYTFLAMQTELLSLLGGRTDIDPPRLGKWLNQAYQGLAAALDLPEFNASIEFDTVGAQPLYLAGASIRRTNSAVVRDTTNYSNGGRPLYKTDLDSLRRLHDESNEPERYYFQNRLIALWPTPTAARTIVMDVFFIPQKMVEDDDAPILGEEWMEVLIARARATAFSALLEFQLAGQAQNEYVAKLREKTDMKAQEKSGMIAGFRPARHARDRHTSNVDRRGDY